jgi:hypothetical protein
MRDIERTIQEVRAIRGDLSTWLVHLTKGNIFPTDAGSQRYFSPKECLESILDKNCIYGVGAVGQFNYSQWYRNVQSSDLRAVSLTETPISEIFLFIGIKYKSLKFSSYGLVFERGEISLPPVHAAPVLYFSQPNGGSHFLKVFSKLEQNHYADYKDILYLFDKFGKTYAGKDYNFMWEREWRIKGDFKEVRQHIKFGLCPESEIDSFESKYPNLTFVDPLFNHRQIERKLKDRGVIP